MSSSGVNTRRVVPRSQGLSALHGGGGEAGQVRWVLGQDIGVGVVEDTVLVQLLDEPHRRLLDEMLDLVIGWRDYRHEGRLTAVGMLHVHAVEHQDVEARVGVESRAEALHKGDASATGVAVAPLRAAATSTGTQRELGPLPDRMGSQESDREHDRDPIRVSLPVAPRHRRSGNR
jgi:hypothetical protein